MYDLYSVTFHFSEYKCAVVQSIIAVASTCHILEGSDISSALEAACDGAAVCESLKDSEQDEDHYLLFSKSYTMQVMNPQGTCRLCINSNICVTLTIISY